MDAVDLSGRNAVVTGAGRGLGRAFAQALADAGASVALLARSEAELRESAAAAGPLARIFPVDVTDAQAVTRAFAQIGPVDILVNNAGVLGPIGPFWKTDFDAWWRAIDVNVRGAMLCAHAALPGMVERRRGSIVNIATGMFAAAYLSPYMTSKTALVRATECLANETRDLGVALFSLAPGSVRTRMTSHSLMSDQGREWIPWYGRIFDDKLDLPAERPAARVVELASGRYDALSGLYLTPFDDLDDMLRNIDSIVAQRLYSPRVHALGPGSPAVAAIRDSAERPKRPLQ
jgi:NAD(P)-dependent dehydrogenase (short-subunit alcohol dehydrogenase family)